ncbi:hypothetical protein Tco_0351195 [Tanacetum coccineum]
MLAPLVIKAVLGVNDNLAFVSVGVSPVATLHKEKNDVELKCNELQGMVLYRDGNIKLFLRELDRVSKERGEFQKQVLAVSKAVPCGYGTCGS